MPAHSISVTDIVKLAPLAAHDACWMNMSRIGTTRRLAEPAKRLGTETDWVTRRRYRDGTHGGKTTTRVLLKGCTRTISAFCQHCDTARRRGNTVQPLPQRPSRAQRNHSCLRCIGWHADGSGVCTRVWGRVWGRALHKPAWRDHLFHGHRRIGRRAVEISEQPARAHQMERARGLD